MNETSSKRLSQILSRDEVHEFGLFLVVEQGVKNECVMLEIRETD